ncbi:hypothetical protein F2P81_005171 [Scophthalmus maximus]|uniref:Uncharacterized protein n=1 Tax=Scophthalmus maximus TaxID=52904 RepID=A0A6A4T9X6_SCOMX|nr:hypothetical protein F2P81_005171 [Scophthalmus maximus]
MRSANSEPSSTSLSFHLPETPRVTRRQQKLAHETFHQSLNLNLILILILILNLILIRLSRQRKVETCTMRSTKQVPHVLLIIIMQNLMQHVWALGPAAPGLSRCSTINCFHEKSSTPESKRPLGWNPSS